MKVSFRRVRRVDLEELNRIVNDPDVCRFMSGVPPITMNSTVKFYEQCGKSGWRWHCIFADGKVVGSALLQPVKKSSRSSHVAEFGVSIAREYWGRGIGSKAVRFILQDARSRGLKKVSLCVVEDNHRARRLYLRHGFREEGRLRKHTKVGGGYRDIILMARLLR
ncbi:MAG: GNAT family protein [Candidatus Altiarchaeota archaeon]